MCEGNMSHSEELEALSDVRISQLLSKFKESSHYRKFHEKRLHAHEFNSKWITPDKIKELSDDELKDKFRKYYQGGEGRQTFNQIYRERIIRDIRRFREMLLHLLDESIPVKQRFKDVVEDKGKYHIEGVGKGLASALLMDFDITKYCLWNNKTIMGLSRLEELVETRLIPRRGDMGEKYIKILKVLKFIRDEVNPELNLTFDDVDCFLHWISAEEEGIKVFNEIAEGKGDLIQVPSPEEKYVSEIIYRKFDETLGKKFNLTLYKEDPENGPKEYPTEVGRIDLLAVEKHTGNFVVIEIKRNPKPSALGQIMKYMGWVKENLAKDKEVKGILLANDIDETLRYALKIAKNIKAIKYTFSIGVEDFL